MDSLVIFIIGYVILLIIIFILLQIIIPLSYRQDNALTQPNVTGRDNHDIFFIEPNIQEAARIRAQLEKDEKDLPSYDEVMRLATLSTQTTTPVVDTAVAPIPNAPSLGASTSSLPPYRGVIDVRPLTPPPYTAEPIGAMVAMPIIAPVHSQRHTQNL